LKLPALSFQRRVQLTSLLFFALLVGLATGPAWDRTLLGYFINLDPVASFGTAVAVRALFAGLWGAGVLLLLTLVFGRFFCGYLCPLGTTIDAADKAARRRNRFFPRLGFLKTLILFAVLGLSLGGLSFVFAVSPLATATRLFALVAEPFIRLAGAAGIDLLRPLADRLDVATLVYAQVKTPHYQSFTWILILTLVPLLGAALVPRFWCRCLCPTGALLAIVSRRPLWRRRVAKTCISCGACSENCPTRAIRTNPFETDHCECITCRSCVNICPIEAVRFSCREFSHRQTQIPDRGRRILIHAGVACAFGSGFYLATSHKTRAAVNPLLRPPGARPEPDFLNRCIRCGACLACCPTNTLQPSGPETGFRGLLAPVLTPAIGPCEPDCTACGQVCPSGAILSLPKAEKWWARPGKAKVVREHCLAWKEERLCLICDEACPFDAIVLRRKSGISLPVPFVRSHRCTGCGYCEYQCPVLDTKAIVVVAEDAIRLNDKRHREVGRLRGLRIRRDPSGGQHSYDPDIVPNRGANGLPPGFTP
jgi:ferredoxin